MVFTGNFDEGHVLNTILPVTQLAGVIAAVYSLFKNVYIQVKKQTKTAIRWLLIGIKPHDI